MLNKFYIKSSIIFIIIFSSFQLTAKAEIAVLNSSTSENALQKSTEIRYSDNWNNIIKTVDSTGIKYSLVSERDINAGRLSAYSAVILPLTPELPSSVIDKIKNYTENGGKVIVFFPQNTVTRTMSELATLAGVSLDDSQEISFASYVNFLPPVKAYDNSFPVQTQIATIRLSDKATSLAVWNDAEENLTAISLSPTGSYMGWKFANDGKQSFSIAALRKVVEQLSPDDLLKKNDSAKTAIDFDKIQKQVLDTSNLRSKTADLVELINHDNDSYIDLAEIQQHLYQSKVEEVVGNTYAADGYYDKAMAEFKNSRNDAFNAYIKSLPSNVVEGRTLWLDRGTIVNISTQEQMAALFDKIKDAGINLVYFEAINAGYPIYPSKITEQNPLTKGRDPLSWAVYEAHARNIELHAWTWIFAVGNNRHNPIISKSADYAGPVLSKNYSLALLGKEGNLVPVNQYEYWLNPANSQARNYISSMLEEIVRSYDVDGIQLDYIRYPFQSGNNLMGYDRISRERFEMETGYSLNKPDENTIKVWNNWKTKQISKFVQDTSVKLNTIKPDIQISAAVFGGSNARRVSTIQQDWENWSQNRWIDILNPMIYANKTEQLTDNLNYFVSSVGDKVLIYPGIAIKNIEDEEIITQLTAIKNMGLSGSTLFAMAHLGEGKTNILSNGPYKYKDAIQPSKNPLNSAAVLMDKFMEKLNSYDNTNSTDLIIKASEIHTAISGGTLVKDPTLLDNTILKLKQLETDFNKNTVMSYSSNQAMSKMLADYLKETSFLLNYYKNKMRLL